MLVLCKKTSRITRWTFLVDVTILWGKWMGHKNACAPDLTAALTGDRDAIGRVLLLHGDQLARRIACRLELNPFVDFSAEDVLQEVFIDAFLGINTFDPERGASFATWLNRLADNRMVSMLRERGRQKRGGKARKVGDNHACRNDAWRSSAAQLVDLLADDCGESPSKDVVRGEMACAVLESVAELPQDQRQAIEMRYLEQRSLESTAEAMTKTNGATRGLLHRAKQSMRSALGTSSRWFMRK